MAIENVLSNDNYVSKDFQSVYEELVDTIGKLNNKWLVDGEGNESDPGVVLLKTIAAAVDKISYNTDKNILENFPDTLQTEEAARAVFYPVYNMKWYISASGNIAIRNDGEESITLPPYLMISSDDGTAIYTTNQSGMTIEAKTTNYNVPVLEGKTKVFLANGSDRITIDNFIDNKIYFDDYNIAQNGIFVSSYDTTESITDKWVMVDNIYVKDWSENDENSGRYYQMRIDPNTNRPYLQFVDDIASKIGNGLKIRYILSNGVSGNVSSGKLTKIYASDSEDIPQDNTIKIVNILPIANGKDPETIESARKNYFKDIDICDTLVTLRDYTNAIYLADGLVSNCFVCDRTNDVQTFRIIQTDGVNNIKESTDDGLTVFNLKFYGLVNRPIGYGDGTDLSDSEKLNLYKNNYKTSFELINPIDYTTGAVKNVPSDVWSYIEDTKSINHEFASIRNQNKITALKNYYTLNIDLLYRQRLSEEQQDEIKFKVYKALLDNLNAHSIDFGERVTYNKVQEIIYAADSRILGASIDGLDDVDFKTNVIYWTPYFNVPLYLTEPESVSVGSYIVVPATNGNYQLKHGVKVGDTSSWQDVESLSTPSDRQYDLPYDTTSEFILIYTEDKHWNAVIPEASISDTSLWCSTSIPSSEVKDGGTSVENVYRISVEPVSNGGDNNLISRYPSQPIKISGFSSQDSSYSSVFKYNNQYYKATIAGKWNYDETPMFFYTEVTGGGASTDYEDIEVLGSFQEINVNSEIDAFGEYDDNFAIGTTDKGKMRGELQTEIYAKTVLSGNASVFDTDFKFSPRITDTAASVLYDVSYIESHFDLKTSSEYALKDNESIQILTPELETIANYSFYVYMGYYTSDAKQILTVSQNQNYELGNNEYIIFYYRSSDEEPFMFTAYRGGDGNIICPSKNITLYNLSWQQSIANSMGDGYTMTTICPSDINNLVEESIKSASNARLTFLMSQDSCDVKRLVQEEIKYYTFVSNNFDRTKGEYTISFTDPTHIDEGNGNNRSDPEYYIKVLEEGESFAIYDTQDPSSLKLIAGAGSIIKSTVNTAITSDVINGVQTPKSAEGKLIYNGADILSLSAGTVIKPIFVAKVEPSQSQTSFITDKTDGDYDSADIFRKVIVRARNVSSDWNNTGGTNQANLDNNTTYNSSTWTYYNTLISYVKQQLSKQEWNDEVSDPVTIYVKFINQTKTGSGKIQDGVAQYFTLDFAVEPQNSLALDGNFKFYSLLPIISYRNSGESKYTQVPRTSLTNFSTLVRSALQIQIEQGGGQTLIASDGESIAQQYVILYDDNNNVMRSTKDLSIPDQRIECIMSSDTDISVIGGKQLLSPKATLTIKGLIRPASLMQYVKINSYFYGQKYIASGLYVITKQTDTINQQGYRTTLELLRVGGDDDS